MAQTATTAPAATSLSASNGERAGVRCRNPLMPPMGNARPSELIDLIATISLTAASEGEKTHRSVDLLGRVYEYFLTRFASAEGKNGGQFYTPSCVVRCLVEPVPVRKDLAPYKGRIYDPACGSGGMFVQSESRSEAETASRRLPVGRTQRGNFVEPHTTVTLALAA